MQYHHPAQITIGSCVLHKRVVTPCVFFIQHVSNIAKKVLLILHVRGYHDVPSYKQDP